MILQAYKPGKIGAWLRFCILFLTGEIFYSATELLWRGYTHVSMTLTGGLCLVLLFRLTQRRPRTPLWLLAFPAAAIITAVEFCVGCVVNLGLGLQVWDYSEYRIQFLGQVCLLYSGLWVLLSVPALALCRLFQRKLFLRFPALFG